MLKVSPAGLTMTAPAFFACSITSSTSVLDPTLCPSVNSVGVLRDARARPDGEFESGLQIKECNCAVLAFLPDDSFGFESQSVTVETQCTLQVIDSDGDHGDARFHGWCVSGRDYIEYSAEIIHVCVAEVPGHVEIEDGSKLKAASIPMTIEASHVDLKPFRTTMTPEGSFKLNLLAGENWIQLRNVPAEYSVVSMTYEGRDVLRRPLVPDLGDTDGIRIVLVPVYSGSVHQVHGQVEGLPPAAIGANTRIVLTGSGLGRRTVQAPILQNGTFEFSAVPSDTYSARIDGAAFLSDSRFDVAATDIDGLRIKGEIRSVVSGRVRIVDRNATILPDFPYRYMAVMFSQASTPIVEAVRTDGTFTATLPGGEYSVITNALPDGYTLKSVVVGAAGGNEITKGKLKIDGRAIPEILVTLEYRPKNNP